MFDSTKVQIETFIKYNYVFALQLHFYRLNTHTHTYIFVRYIHYVCMFCGLLKVELHGTVQNKCVIMLALNNLTQFQFISTEITT